MHILIADDHAVVRRGLREILADALPGADFSEAGNGDEVLSQSGQISRVALLVLDINMPGRSGMDVLAGCQARLPAVAGDHPELPPGGPVCRALPAGRRSRLYQQGRAPQKSWRWRPRRYSAAAAISARALQRNCSPTWMSPSDKPLHELLSDREHEVMKMIAAGVPLTEIGDRLHVSVKTISSYRARIMEKMQMKSNADLPATP